MSDGTSADTDDSAFRAARGRTVRFDCPHCPFESMATVRWHAEEAARAHRQHCGGRQ